MNIVLLDVYLPIPKGEVSLTFASPVVPVITIYYMLFLGCHAYPTFTPVSSPVFFLIPHLFCHLWAVDDPKHCFFTCAGPHGGIFMGTERSSKDCHLTIVQKGLIPLSHETYVPKHFLLQYTFFLWLSKRPPSPTHTQLY